jgi:hypothetical protein
VPAIPHPGEIVLNAGEQKNVAAGHGAGQRINSTKASAINGTGSRQSSWRSFLIGK